jgi:hypothetical protein
MVEAKVDAVAWFYYRGEAILRDERGVTFASWNLCRTNRQKFFVTRILTCMVPINGGEGCRGQRGR